MTRHFHVTSPPTSVAHNAASSAHLKTYASATDKGVI